MLALIRFGFWLLFIILIIAGTLSSPVRQIFKHWDQVLHVGIFLALAVLWITGYGRHVACIATLFLVGLLIEAFQGIVLPMRTADPLDVVANLLGIIAGTMIGSFIRSNYMSRQSRGRKAARL